uniref:Putative vasotab-like protein n=1 Tax=Haematobia irritans TaxID=7368 RepID=A0A1L8EJA5_HAEIR
MHLKMKIAILLLLIVVLCHHSVNGNACPKTCPVEVNPVCGTFHRGTRNGFITCTFDNYCKLTTRECMANEKWLSRQGRCNKENPDCTKFIATLPVTTTPKPKSPGVLEKSKNFFKGLFGKTN